MRVKRLVSKIVLKDGVILWVYGSDLLNSIDIKLRQGNKEIVYKFRSFKKAIMFLKEIIKDKENVKDDINMLWVGRVLWTQKRFYEYVLDY